MKQKVTSAMLDSLWQDFAVIQAHVLSAQGEEREVLRKQLKKLHKAIKKAGKR